MGIYFILQIPICHSVYYKQYTTPSRIFQPHIFISISLSSEISWADSFSASRQQNQCRNCNKLTCHRQLIFPAAQILRPSRHLFVREDRFPAPLFSIWTILCDLTFDYLHKTAISQFYRRESRIELFIYRITPPKNKSSYIRCSCPIRLSAYWISTKNAVKALTDSGMITKFARMYQGTAWHFHANCWFRRH